MKKKHSSHSNTPSSEDSTDDAAAAGHYDDEDGDVLVEVEEMEDEEGEEVNLADYSSNSIAPSSSPSSSPSLAEVCGDIDASLNESVLSYSSRSVKSNSAKSSGKESIGSSKSNASMSREKRSWSDRTDLTNSFLEDDATNTLPLSETSLDHGHTPSRRVTADPGNFYSFHLIMIICLIDWFQHDIYYIFPYFNLK